MTKNPKSNSVYSDLLTTSKQKDQNSEATVLQARQKNYCSEHPNMCIIHTQFAYHLLTCSVTFLTEQSKGAIALSHKYATFLNTHMLKWVEEAG